MGLETTINLKWGGIKMNGYVNDLTRERDGYVMRNEKDDVEITCTEKFVEAWKKRGFVIVRKGLIQLMKEKE